MMDRVGVPYGERFEEMVAELRGSGSIDLTYERRDPQRSLGAEAVELLESLSATGFPSSAMLGDCYVPNSRLAIGWRGVGEYAELGGACDINPIPVCLEMEVPVDSFANNDADSRLLNEMYVFDEITQYGETWMTALRFVPASKSLEVWYLDRDLPLSRMSIDYCEYLDYVLLTKGVDRWQLLFTSLDLSDPVMRRPLLRDVEIMIRLFPTLFPEQDYEPLRIRLEERLAGRP